MENFRFKTLSIHEWGGYPTKWKKSNVPHLVRSMV